MTVSSPGTFRHLQDVFQNGLRMAGPNAKCLGSRPVVSTSPLKFGDCFEWQTWGTVDARRKALGSGLCKMFQDGTIGNGTLPAIGIWSKNSARE